MIFNHLQSFSNDYLSTVPKDHKTGNSLSFEVFHFHKQMMGLAVRIRNKGPMTIELTKENVWSMLLSPAMACDPPYLAGSGCFSKWWDS